MPRRKPRRRFPPEILNRQEVAALINACHPTSPTGIRSRALLAVLYRSGIRIKEALGVSRHKPHLEHRDATDVDVSRFEMGIAARLPDDYREFLIRHNGGYPEPSGFRAGLRLPGIPRCSDARRRYSRLGRGAEKKSRRMRWTARDVTG